MYDPRLGPPPFDLLHHAVDDARVGFLRVSIS